MCYPVVGVANGFGLTVSPDSKSVYLAATALVAFRRAATNGHIYWAGCFRDSGALNGYTKATGLDGAARATACSC